MNAGNRTSKSIKNGGVALVIFFINLVLQFYSRKIFLDYLGSEVLGLNSTATNLLQFLNLAELGIGSAVACTLYKPLADNDYESIINIVSLQGKLYKCIAFFVIGGGIIMSLFFPLIFKKMELPLWYAYASFGVLIFSSLLSYFVNYKQILLTANQQEYKIQYTYRLTMIIKVVCQIVAMLCFPHPYISWLIIEALFTIIASIGLSLVVKKTFPFLRQSSLSFRQLNSKYHDILTKVKQVFVHKISAFALLQLSPLIIYYYATLSLVTVYSNYLIIITGITSLLSAVFNSIVAGIGNLLTEAPEKAYVFFNELFSLRFFVASVSCYLFYSLADSFISLWLGKEYILPNSTLILLTITLFITLIRQTLDNYVYAYGIFSDLWAPVAETTINIVLAFVLGHHWGINGIILGAIVSQILIVLIWRPYFLFTKGIRKSVWRYWLQFAKHSVITVLAVIPCVLLLPCVSVSGYVGLIIRFFTELIFFGGILLIIMNLANCEIIFFQRRILGIVIRHISPK